MKKLAFMGGVAALGIGLATLLIAQQPTHAADHLDADSLATNPLADINDVYAWMDAGGSKVNLAMTISPADPGTRHFGPAVQYVFHVSSKTPDTKHPLGVGTAGTETDVICTFASDTSAQCWVGNKDYVTGDPSSTTGVMSHSGNVKLFAGRRSDPFFFNLQGYKDAVGFVKAAFPNGIIRSGVGQNANAAGCPFVDAASAMVLRTKLTTQSVNGATATPPCSTTNPDCFAPFNALAIVLQVDKSLFNTGTNTIVGVWASTHTTPAP